MIELPINLTNNEENEDDKVSDREILNIFRKSSEKVLKTSEIAEELPITQNWTGTRLDRLENKGRVHSKLAGSRSRVWWLSEEEVDRPVADGYGDLMWYRSVLKRSSTIFYLIAFGLYGSAGVLLVPYLVFDIYPSLQSDIISKAVMSYSALLGARVASLSLIAAAFFHLTVLGIDRLTT